MEENTQKGRNENCGVLEKENLLKSQGDSVSRIKYDTGSLIPRAALPSPPQHCLQWLQAHCQALNYSCVTLSKIPL